MRSGTPRRAPHRVTPSALREPACGVATADGRPVPAHVDQPRGLPGADLVEVLG